MLDFLIYQSNKNQVFIFFGGDIRYIFQQGVAACSKLSLEVEHA